MQDRALLCPLMVIVLSTFSLARGTGTGGSVKNQYVAATVLSVHEEAVQSNYVGDSPTDAPLQASAHIFDIAVQLNCGTYVGRYQSAFKFVPDILTPNRPVRVWFQKRVMDVRVPGEDLYHMAIVKRPRGTRGCESR